LAILLGSAFGTLFMALHSTKVRTRTSANDSVPPPVWAAWRAPGVGVALVTSLLHGFWPGAGCTRLCGIAGSAHADEYFSPAALWRWPSLDTISTFCAALASHMPSLPAWSVFCLAWVSSIPLGDLRAVNYQLGTRFWCNSSRRLPTTELVDLWSRTIPATCAM